MIKIKRECIWNAGPQQGRLQSIRLHSVGQLMGKCDHIACRFDLWGVGIVWRGAGRYRVGKTNSLNKVVAPFFFYIWPGEFFDYAPDPSWDESFVSFSGQRCAEWEDCEWLQRSNTVYPIHSPLDEIKQLHRQILDNVLTGESSRVDSAKSMTEQLLGMLNQHQVRSFASLPHIQQIEALAQKWRKESWHAVDFEESAQTIGMSYPNFRRKFRAIIGQSPYQYLSAQRIAHACRLLLSTRLSIKEIATHSGFDYTESFNRLFRGHMGQTPKQYRASPYVQRSEKT